MAEQLQRTHPLQSRLEALGQLPAGFEVTVDPYRTMTTLRYPGDGPAAADVAAVLGVQPPSRPNTWVGGRDAQVVWLGPDEWLVISDLAASATQEAQLRAAVGPSGGAAVDVSGQRVTMTLRGRHVRDILAKGCPVDLHPRVFPAGSSAQTTLGQAGVVLLADGNAGTTDGTADHTTRFTVLVRPSFATYLADWLTDAAEEFRAE